MQQARDMARRAAPAHGRSGASGEGNMNVSNIIMISTRSSVVSDKKTQCDAPPGLIHPNSAVGHAQVCIFFEHVIHLFISLFIRPEEVLLHPSAHNNSPPSTL